MSPFVIFLIVLIVAYILYYAAMITIDLNKKPKENMRSMESVDINGFVDGGQDEEQEVEEDGDSDSQGSLPVDDVKVSDYNSFEDNKRFMPEESVTENSPGLDVTQDSDVSEKESDVKQDSVGAEYKHDSDQVHSDGETSGNEDSADVSVDGSDVDVPADDTDSDSEKDNGEDKESGIPGIPDDAIIHEGDEVHKEDDDANDPFDSSLGVEKYSVTHLVSGPKKRTEGDEMADAANDTLEEVKSFSPDAIIGEISDDLLRNEDSLKDNKIVHKNEYTQL